jgi:hypothetical protein
MVFLLHLSFVYSQPGWNRKKSSNGRQSKKLQLQVELHQIPLAGARES